MDLRGVNLNERLGHKKRVGDRQAARKGRKQCQSCSRTACLETVTKKTHCSENINQLLLLLVNTLFQHKVKMTF